MAIFQPADGYTQPVVVDGTRYQGNLAIGATAQTANNNRAASRAGASASVKVKSAGFAQLDALITSLDATYDLLPNQDDWIAQAAAWDGLWSLCANCVLDLTGKKLFRQVNFNRALLNLPLLTSPTGLVGPPDAEADAALVATIGGTITSAKFEGDGGSGVLYFVATIGRALGNPTLAFDTSLWDVVIPGPSDLASWILTVVPTPGTSVVVPVCIYDSDGSPGQRVLVTFTHTGY